LSDWENTFQTPSRFIRVFLTVRVQSYTLTRYRTVVWTGQWLPIDAICSHLSKCRFNHFLI